MRFVQQRKVYSEGFVRCLSSRDGLEDQIDGCAVSQRLHLSGDMGQHAALCGNSEFLARVIDKSEQCAY